MSNINPCKACIDKFKNGRCGVHNINDCCYDTLAAFTGSQSVNDIRYVDNCVDCVQQFLKAEGKTSCDLNIKPPPIWNDVPHYFPRLLQELDDPDQSLITCKQLCSENDKLHVNKCHENCETDFNAVQYVTDEIKMSRSSKNSNNSLSYIGMLIFVILVCVYFCIRYRNKRLISF